MEEKFKPRDIHAIITVLCCFTLIALGFDGEIKAVLGMIIGFYFGLYTITPKKPSNGKSDPTQHTPRMGTPL